MHMADALLSPTVGCTMWAVSAGSLAYCSKRVREGMDDSKIPLMGVLGAFIFAAQMINFTIPATGSSGHLGGGLLLSILLGPYAAFLTIASVLTVQALFFADGGLLALGCNIFNLGIFPAFIAYPLIYKKIVQNSQTRGRITAACVISSVIGLQLGALSVVLETVASGISSLPFSAFVTLMQPIHLGIGVVEGFVTASVVSFVYKARPEVLHAASGSASVTFFSARTFALAFLFATILTGGVFSWFSSGNPDGLEWSIKKITGKEELENRKGSLHAFLASLQDKLAVLPDYSLKKPDDAGNNDDAHHTGEPVSNVSTKSVYERPENSSNRFGTSLSGILGGFITLAMAGFIGIVLKVRTQSV